MADTTDWTEADWLRHADDALGAVGEEGTRLQVATPDGKRRWYVLEGGTARAMTPAEVEQALGVTAGGARTDEEEG